MAAVAMLAVGGSLSASAFPGISASSTGTILTPLTPFSPGPTTSPTGVVTTGSLVYVSDPANNTIDVYSLGGTLSSSIVLTLCAQPSSLAISPDGATLYAVCGPTNTVDSIDLAGPTETVFPVANQPRGIVLSPDGSFFYLLSNSDAQVHKYDASTPGAEIIASVTNGLYATPFHIAVSSDGATVYVTYRDHSGPATSGGLRILRASDLFETTHVDIASAQGLALEANGDVVVGSDTGSSGPVVELSPAGTLTGRSTALAGYSRAEVLLTSPDGSTVYAYEAASGQLYAIDLATFTAGALIGPIGNTAQMAVTPDGLHLYAAGGSLGSTHNVYPFAVARLTLTGPATIVAGTGPTTFDAQIADGRTPVGDYSSGSVLFEILDSSNAVVASAAGIPSSTTGDVSKSIDLSGLPAGSYSVRATLDPIAGSVVVTASGFTISKATALAATGTDTTLPMGVGIVMLLGGILMTAVSRRQIPSRRRHAA